MELSPVPADPLTVHLGLEQRLSLAKLRLQHRKEQVDDKVRTEEDEQHEVRDRNLRTRVHDAVHHLRPPG